MATKDARARRLRISSFEGVILSELARISSSRFHLASEGGCLWSEVAASNNAAAQSTASLRFDKILSRAFSYMVCACRGFDFTCWLTSSRNSKAESIVVVDPDLLVELWRCGARIALMKQIQRQIQRPERERERNIFRPALSTWRATDCLRTKFTCIPERLDPNRTSSTFLLNTTI